MKVSVVLCTYALDMYDHFREAADSVLDQTYDDDQRLSIVDYTIRILTDERGVKHVFAFDSDFRTLELSPVPADVTPLNE